MLYALFSFLVLAANANDFPETAIGATSEHTQDWPLKYGKLSWIKATGSSDITGEVVGCRGPESDTICTWKVIFKPTKPGLHTAKLQLHFDFGPYPDDEFWTYSGVGVELKPPVAEMCHPGSIIHLESGVLREEIPVVGVPFSLFYSSSLAKGFNPNYLKFGGSPSFNPDTLTPSIHHFLDLNNNKLYLGDGTSVDAKVVSLKDGTLFVDGAGNRQEVYIFSKSGVHLGTKSRMLGAWIYQFKYDSAARLVQIVYGAGKIIIKFERSASGELKSISSGFNQVTTIESSGKLITGIINPLGEKYLFEYDAKELLTTFTKPEGQSSHFEYAENGLLISDVNSAGNLTRIERKISGAESFVQFQSALGNKSSITGGPALIFGKSGYQSKSLDPLQLSTVVSHVGTSIRTDRDGSSYIRDFLVDPRTKSLRPSWVEEAHGGAGWYSLGKWFNSDPKVVVDPFSYNTSTTTFYEVINKKTTTLGSSVFDARKRTLTNTSKEGVKIVTTYDSFERPIAVKGGDDVATEFSYDPMGRMKSLNKKGTSLLSFKYDSNNNLVEIVNPVGAKKSLEYDGAARITKVTQQDGSEVKFGYDKNGNLTSVVPANKEKYEFVHNSLELISSFLPPLFNGAEPTAIRYEYDLEKKITKIIRPNSATISFSYDAAGKLEFARTAEGDYENNFYSDSPSVNWSQTPDGVRHKFKYLGTLVTEKNQAADGSGNLQVKYSYDEKYRVKRFEAAVGSDIAGYDVSYNFDSKIIKAGDETLTWGVPSGRLLKRNLGALTELRKYDEFGELKSIEVQLSGKVTKSIFVTLLFRDRLGRIIKKEDSINGVKEVFEYLYDAAGRLKITKKNGQEFSRYEYDANGNRTGGIHAGNLFSASFDREDRMLAFNSEKYSYDGDGNLISILGLNGETKLKYTSFGKLSKVENATGTIKYKIDPSGVPVVRVEGESEERSIFYGTSKLAALVNGKSNITRFVYASGITTPDYLIKDGQKYFVVQDHLGSPRLLIDSKTGTIAQEITYSDLGLILKNSNPGFQPFGYAGGLLDHTTGLVRFGARHYDPRIGRWISKDPILFLGGSSNLYGYVSNDPINLIDPTGLVDLMMCGDGPCGGGLRDQHMSATAMSVEEAKKNDAIISNATMIAAGVVLAAPMIVDTAVVVGGPVVSACLANLAACTEISSVVVGGFVKGYLDEPDKTPPASWYESTVGMASEYVGGCLSGKKDGN